MGYIGLALLAFIVVLVIKSWVSISPSERGVKERFSNYVETLGSGWHMIIPFFDTVRIVDVREKVFMTGSHEMITKDNAVVTVDAVLYLQIIDPYKAIYEISDPANAVIQVVQADLRSKIGQLILDECLSERGKINADVQTKLSEETAKWGVKVTKVEIQKIEPPADLIKSMQEQKKAEQEKRAQILRAEGSKEAAIREAEGLREKQKIEAEGFREKQVLEAQGQAEAIERLAAAKAKAIELESNAAISYFKDNAVIKEQLRVMEESLKLNSKYVISADIFNMLKGFMGK